jgi:hypothetical protein
MKRGSAGDSADLSNVRAIAIDTNAFPHGQLDLDALRRLVKRAARHGAIEVWVPEVAIWEWAEHAAAQYQTAVNALTAIVATGLNLPSLPVLAKQHVLRQLHDAISALGAPLVILPVGSVAAEALRDQVFVEGPARTITAKDSKVVKVGAADSALLRSLLERASDDTSSFVLVSSDRDVLRAFEDWGLEPPGLYRTVRGAANAVFTTVPSQAQVQASCLSFLATGIDDLEFGRLGGDVLAELYDDYTSELANEECYADAGRHVVGLSDTFVDHDGEVVTGTAFVLAHVTAAGVAQDAFGDSTVTRWTNSTGALVRIPVTFTLDDGSPVDVDADTGEGEVVRPHPDEYTAAEDAFQEVVDVLRALPGARDLVWDEPDDDDAVRTLELPFGKARLEFTGDLYEEWELSVSVDGLERGKVSCTYLNDAVGDSEGIVFPGHYALSTDITVGFARANPLWAINAALLDPPVMDWHDLADPDR